MNQFSQFVATNWILVLALLVILVLLARTYIGPGSGRGVGAMQAVTMINHNNAIIVDVRTDNEFQNGHILNAIHIPLGLFESKIQELDAYKNRPIIASCQSGNRSGQALGLLKKRGFTDVYNLSGGILAWQNANLPLTTESSVKPKASKKSAAEKAKEETARLTDETNKAS